MTDQCRRCGASMLPGIATGQTYTKALPDLGGTVETLNAGGPGVLIDCWKCPACGYSVTKKEGQGDGG